MSADSNEPGVKQPTASRLVHPASELGLSKSRLQGGPPGLEVAEINDELVKLLRKTNLHQRVVSDSPILIFHAPDPGNHLAGARLEGAGPAAVESHAQPWTSADWAAQNWETLEPLITDEVIAEALLPQWCGYKFLKLLNINQPERDKSLVPMSLELYTAQPLLLARALIERSDPFDWSDMLFALIYKPGEAELPAPLREACLEALARMDNQVGEVFLAEEYAQYWTRWTVYQTAISSLRHFQDSVDSTRVEVVQGALALKLSADQLEPAQSTRARRTRRSRRREEELSPSELADWGKYRAFITQTKSTFDAIHKDLMERSEDLRRVLYWLDRDLEKAANDYPLAGTPKWSVEQLDRFLAELDMWSERLHRDFKAHHARRPRRDSRKAIISLVEQIRPAPPQVDLERLRAQATRLGETLDTEKTEIALAKTPQLHALATLLLDDLSDPHPEPWDGVELLSFRFVKGLHDGDYTLQSGAPATIEASAAEPSAAESDAELDAEPNTESSPEADFLSEAQPDNEENFAKEVDFPSEELAADGGAPLDEAFKSAEIQSTNNKNKSDETEYNDYTEQTNFTSKNTTKPSDTVEYSKNNEKKSKIEVKNAQSDLAEVSEAARSLDYRVTEVLKSIEPVSEAFDDELDIHTDLTAVTEIVAELGSTASKVIVHAQELSDEELAARVQTLINGESDDNKADHGEADYSESNSDYSESKNNGSDERELSAYYLLAEQQRRWLCRGQGLGALLIADYQSSSLHEPADADLHPIDASIIPSWLCRVVIRVSDSGAHMTDLSVGEVTSEVFGLEFQPASVQKFAAIWLCVGLWHESVGFSLRIAELLTPAVLDADWVNQSPFWAFCMRHLLKPARRGELPQVVTERSEEVLKKELDIFLQRAHDEIGSDRGNFKKSFVKQFWRDLVHANGPAGALLEQLKRGEEPEQWPTPAELAEQVEQWDKIVAKYRNNILNRLTAFLKEARHAARVQRELKSRRSRQENVLNAATLNRALEDGRPLLEELDEMGSPVAYPVELLLDQLQALEQTS